jgi:hypothetical protein
MLRPSVTGVGACGCALRASTAPAQACRIEKPAAVGHGLADFQRSVFPNIDDSPAVQAFSSPRVSRSKHTAPFVMPGHPPPGINSDL